MILSLPLYPYRAAQRPKFGQKSNAHYIVIPRIQLVEKVGHVAVKAIRRTEKYVNSQAGKIVIWRSVAAVCECVTTGGEDEGKRNVPGNRHQELVGSYGIRHSPGHVGQQVPGFGRFDCGQGVMHCMRLSVTTPALHDNIVHGSSGSVHSVPLSLTTPLYMHPVM